MSRIVPIHGEKILIKIGNGASPEVFAHPTVINTTRAISFSTSTETDELCDINDQSLPATTVRRVKSTDLKIDGAGLIHKADIHEWIEWAQSGEIKNVKTYVDDETVIAVPMLLTSFQINGDRLKTSECQITLEQADAPTVTTA